MKDLITAAENIHKAWLEIYPDGPEFDYETKYQFKAVGDDHKRLWIELIEALKKVKEQ